MIPAITFMRRLSSLIYLGLLVAGLAAAAAMGIFFMVVSDLPRVPEPLSRIIETPPTEIFAATGERVLLLGSLNDYYTLKYNCYNHLDRADKKPYNLLN